MGKQRTWPNSHGRAAAISRSFKNGGHDDEPTSSAGCMCAVFQLFDFHPHHHSQSPISSSPPFTVSTAGTEAPRNSLESDDEFSKARLHIPMGVVQIKTRSDEQVDGEGINSPSLKTPTLVARLMGLDLLPQDNSPATTPRTPNYPLLQKPKSRNDHGPRSLPETPRTSCERKSNMENYHHRLSLQIPSYDKENTNPSPNPSPRHYAREIVKQVKESSTRKAGLDITNYTRKDESLIQTKPNKALSSPRRRALEPKNVNKPTPKLDTSKKKKTKTEPMVQISPADDRKRSKKEIHEKFGRPARIMKKATTNDSPGKKCKKTPLSNELLKKELPFSSGRVPQMQLSRFQNQPHKTLHDVKAAAAIVAVSSTAHDCSSNHVTTAELEYVREMLGRRSSPVYSASFLDANNEVSISHQSDRKLLSHLVEELLKPYVEMKPWAAVGGVAAMVRWPELVEKLCDKVRRYPRAKCQVLEDIDGIIEKDLDRNGIEGSEEREWIVKEIEEGIVEELLKETVGLVCV